MGEISHFKFCMLTDTDEYYSTHDRLLLKGMC